MAQWNIWGPFDDAKGKLETLALAMGTLRSPYDGDPEGPKPRILFKLMGPKY